MPDAPSVAFITLGCPKNEVDTDRMRAAVSGAGYHVLDDAEDADVAVVNTCSFIKDATEESIATVLDVASEWLPHRQGRHIVVAGCMPSRYGADLAEAMPEVSAFIPVAEEGAIIDVLGRLVGGATGRSSCPRRTATGASAYLQVSDGCHRKCAYCTIPGIRGDYRSRVLSDILSEAIELVALGAKEIVLIGQDTSSYGRDLDGPETIADVVDAVAKVPGLRWLRLMYVQPDGVSDELLEAIARHDNVCRYLDIPLQHASKSVLRAMNRRGDAASFLDLIDRVRRVLPDVVLRTTMIAGFPGETRADAAAVTAFLEAARFDYVGVFPYSTEAGTSAGEMSHQIPRRTRIARAQRFRDVADEIGFEKAGSRLGQTLEVLVEGYDEDEEMSFGRWRGQAPEIDGFVLLDKGETGQIVKARIVDSFGYDLEGEVVQ